MARPRPPGIIEKILVAGEAVVVRDGVTGASITAIAREAGVSVGSVYHYFEDKQSLVNWVIITSLWPRLEIPEEVPLGKPPLTITDAVARYQDLEPVLPVLHEVSSRPLDDSMEAELRDVVAEYCQLSARTDRVQTIVEVCSAEIEELRRAWYLDYRRALVAAYEQYLRRRMGEGVLRRLADPTFAARWILDTTVLFLRLRRLDYYPDELPTDDLAEHVVDMIVGGLSGAGKPDRAHAVSAEFSN